MKWYTAVGVKMESTGGVFRVRTGLEVKHLLGAECYLWNTLLWTFVREYEIYERMQWLLNLSFPEEPEKSRVEPDEFTYAFRRLLQRELLIFCEEETKEAAAGKLLKSASVACVNDSFGERFLTFCECMVGGSRFYDSLQVFKKKPIEQTYRKLLKEIQGRGKAGFPLKETDGLLEAVIELHQHKLLFIQSVKEGLVA